MKADVHSSALVPKKNKKKTNERIWIVCIEVLLGWRTFMKMVQMHRLLRSRGVSTNQSVGARSSPDAGGAIGWRRSGREYGGWYVVMSTLQFGWATYFRRLPLWSNSFKSVWQASRLTTLLSHLHLHCSDSLTVNKLVYQNCGDGCNLD